MNGCLLALLDYCVGLLLRLSNIEDSYVGYWVLFVRLWKIVVVSYFVVRWESRQSSVFVDRSFASLHWCDRLRGRVPTFVVDVELPLCVNVSFCIVAAFWLWRSTFAVSCLLSTEFDDYSEHLHHLVRVLWITSRTGASRFVVYTTVNLLVSLD